MENRKRFIAIIVLDLLVFILMALGISFSMFDIRFMGNFPRLSSLPIWMTFTGLSNIFIGLVCLGCAIYRLVKKEMVLPKILFMIKIIALADITITFLTTALYLAPSIGSIWWRLYINNNIFNHFLTPLVAIVTFILLQEYVETDWKDCFFSLVPLAMYGIFYIINVYTHLTPEGETSLTYDIYGFCRFGVFVLILFIIAFAAVSFGLTLFYRVINKKTK